MKITKGDWEAQEDSFKGLKGLSVTSCDLSAPLIIAFLWADGCEEIQIQQKANAALIAEAGTVHNETGYTPRQLADQKKALLDACEILVRNPIIASIQAPIKAHAEKEGLLNCMDLIFEAIAGATN